VGCSTSAPASSSPLYVAMTRPPPIAMRPTPTSSPTCCECARHPQRSDYSRHPMHRCTTIPPDLCTHSSATHFAVGVPPSVRPSRRAVRHRPTRTQRLEQVACAQRNPRRFRHRLAPLGHVDWSAFFESFSSTHVAIPDSIRLLASFRRRCDHLPLVPVS